MFFMSENLIKNGHSLSNFEIIMGCKNYLKAYNYTYVSHYIDELSARVVIKGKSTIGDDEILKVPFGLFKKVYCV